MSKRNEKTHSVHVSKNVKFKQPKPSVPTNISPNATQEPLVGTNAKNQIRY